MDEGFKGRSRRGMMSGSNCKIDERWNYKKRKCEKKSKDETRWSIIISFIVVIIISSISIFHKLWYFLILILILFVIFMIFNYSSIKNSFS